MDMFDFEDGVFPDLQYPKYKDFFYKTLPIEVRQCSDELVYFAELIETAEDADDELVVRVLSQHTIHLYYRFIKCVKRVLRGAEIEFARNYELKLPDYTWPKAAPQDKVPVSTDELLYKSECEANASASVRSEPKVEPPQVSSSSSEQLPKKKKSRCSIISPNVISAVNDVKPPQRKTQYSARCRDLTGNKPKIGVNTSWHHAEYWSGRRPRDKRCWQQIQERKKKSAYARDLDHMAMFIKECKHVIKFQNYDDVKRTSLIASHCSGAYVGSDFVALSLQNDVVPRCKFKLHSMSE